MPNSILDILVKVNDKDLQGLNKDLDATGKSARASEGHASKFAGALGTIGKTAAIAGGAAAIGGLYETMKIGFGEWQESTKVAAQTNAVLKSTGGVAGVSAGQVSDLAGQIMRKTGIDDEAIQSGENLLLTFKGIRNEAGKGNDVFNQTTKVVTDMSTAMGTDMKSQAILVGKALNDPIKGLTALTRVGVTFTQGQKDQIKAMVESGNTMGAQKLILHELNSEFGGSAEAIGKTLPGQMNILKESFNNLAGQLVGAMMPAIIGLVGGLTSAITWLQSSGSASDKFRDILEHLGLSTQTIQSILNGLGQTVDGLRTTFNTAVNIISAIWAKFGDNIKTEITNALGFVLNTLRNVFTVIQGIFHVFHGILTGDWSEAWNGIKQILSGVWNQIVNIIQFQINTITNRLDAAWKLIGGTITSVWNGIKNTLSGIWNGIQNTASNTFNGIKNTISNAFNEAKNLASGAMNSLVGLVSSAWSRITGAVADGRDNMIGIVKAIPGRIKSAIGDLSSVLYDAGASLIQGLINGIESKVQSAISTIVNAASRIKNAATGFFHIGSPSKVFHEIGQNLMLGLSNGIMAGTQPAVKTMTNAADALLISPASMTSLSGGGSLLARGSGSASGGQAINVYVAGSVVTEREITDAVYKGLLAKQSRNPLAIGG